MLTLYSLLGLGAVATLYPFLLMVATGLKGPTDQNDNRLFPEYWQNLDGRDEKGAVAEGSLLGKYLSDKYAGDLSMIKSTRLGTEQLPPDQISLYHEFLEQLPTDYWAAGFRTAPNQVTSRLRLRYVSWLRQRYRTIDELNRAYIEENTAFQTVQPPTESLDRRIWRPSQGRKYGEWLEFKSGLPAEYRIPVRAERMFQEFLRSRHQNQLDAVPEAIRAGAASFEEILLPESGPLLQEFREKWLPPRYHQATTEDLWKAYVKRRFEGPAGDSAGNLSDGASTQLVTAAPVMLAGAAAPPDVLPVQAYERDTVRENATRIRREFSTRNYLYVLDYIALNGRALWNTALFCLLAIGTQLTINPLAAYALSRYPIRASGKILIFLLATMAFPAEVAMIPSFLLLKDLGLLNTFAALVLPTAASGYMIFLLKGFFDSLPQELFEAGQIDGAKETTMMTRIALPLSKPVLGYMALLAFMGAYGAFLYAFLVAQDQRMWTLMVWIFQLQNSAPKSVMMAALTLAAIPTLIVFLAAQRVIMRGIVLPGER
jgi:multiple sugar transport system permease protein